MATADFLAGGRGSRKVGLAGVASQVMTTMGMTTTTMTATVLFQISGQMYDQRMVPKISAGSLGFVYWEEDSTARDGTNVMMPRVGLIIQQSMNVKALTVTHTQGGCDQEGGRT